LNVTNNASTYQMGNPLQNWCGRRENIPSTMRHWLNSPDSQRI